MFFLKKNQENQVSGSHDHPKKNSIAFLHNYLYVRWSAILRVMLCESSRIALQKDAPADVHKMFFKGIFLKFAKKALKLCSTLSFAILI